MSRADRLFRLVDELRRHRFRTAAQLAETFEVSERTIYRDVVNLSSSGVPISGEAGVGYRLDPTYRLPPLMFDTSEVEALVTGMRMVESFCDDELGQQAKSVLSKVSAVLPLASKEQLSTTALFSLAFGSRRAAARSTGRLREAINRRQKLHFDYEDEAGRPTRRTVRPLGLYFWGSAWTLAAYCELREDFRNFRTDRISKLTVSKLTFEHVSPCTLADYVAAMNR
jgi:predicted DNA-binding transcriptional regulator YafY